MRTKIKIWMMTLIFLSMINLSNVVHASLYGSLLQITAVDEEIVAYVQCDSGVNSVEAQIAQYPCEEVYAVTQEEVFVHTVILMDNSLSVTESNRENIKNILRQYVQDIPEQEVVSLAVFGEDIQFLAEKSRDKDEFLRIIDEIEFHNQDTYLTDYLYEELEKIENDPVHTRFVIISDGVDNKAIGITKEELLNKLKEISRPVYAVGHIYKDNEAELKNLFALSRITGGKALMIEDYDDVGTIANEIHDLSCLYSVRAKIPHEVRDGDSKSVLLKIHTQEGELEVTGEARMPFGTAAKEGEEKSIQVEIVPVPVPESVPQPVEEIETQPEEDPLLEEPDPKNEIKSGGGPIKIIWIAVLIIAIILLILYQKKNKMEKKPASKKKEDKKAKKNKVMIPAHPVMPEPLPLQQESETVFLDGRYLLVLRDRMNPDRIFRYPLDGHVIVGRNVDMVQIAIDYDRTISKRHCEFYVRNNRFFVRDMGSSNHTYLDGRMLDSEMEIVSGSIVKLGEVELSVEIMPI